MPARWSEILLSVMSAMDDADRDLNDTDRNCFYAQLIAGGIRRREHRFTSPARHPLPQGQPLHARDPSGEDADPC